MDARFFLLSLPLFFSCFSLSSDAYQFVVGGKDGWVVNPSENYNQWASRNRFQVNDTLLFKYDKSSDSVLAVSKDDYNSCNTGNPVTKLDDGNSFYKFGHSGPFYFISGNQTHCYQGQKLLVVVLAVRNRPAPPPGSPSPASGAPPTGSSSPSPSPASGGSPSPATSSPSPSPAGTNAAGPSPAAGSGPTSAGSPDASTPASGGTPADGNAPGGSPRRNGAAPSGGVSVVVVSVVSLVFTVGFGGFVFSP